MAELLPQEEALMSRAREADAARDTAFEEMAPSGDFPSTSLLIPLLQPTSMDHYQPSSFSSLRWWLMLLMLLV